MPFFQTDERLSKLANKILQSTWEEFPGLSQDQIALTWVVYDPPVIVNTGGAISPDEFWKHPVRGFSYRGVERIYPASIVKLFYLVAIEEWLETGMISSSPELERAISDMIVNSSNDATSLVIDMLTGTTSGPELPPGPFETWKQQRNLINRYFQSLDWEELNRINVNQKTWCEGPYGRERLFVGEMMENRNMLTTNAVARLLHSIIGGVAVSAARSQTILTLLKRQFSSNQLTELSEENQITGFLGEGLPANATLWSKAGWTSQVRHDAVYVEIPEHPPFLLVVFLNSQEYSQSRTILPFISQSFVEAVNHV